VWIIGGMDFCLIKSKIKNAAAMLNTIVVRRRPEMAEPSASLTRSVPVKHTQELEFVTRPAPEAGKIALPTMEGLCFEKVKHITYLEASGNYTVLHFKDKRQVLICKTLREVEQMLSDRAFVRIHRSHTIHLKHLKKYVRGKGGQVLLQNGVMLTVSTGQKESFLAHLKCYFG
jgi:DNA-binding LytR/AlgR family response regulator